MRSGARGLDVALALAGSEVAQIHAKVLQKPCKEGLGSARDTALTSSSEKWWRTQSCAKMNSMQTFEVLDIILLIGCVALAVALAVTSGRLRSARLARQHNDNALHTDTQHVLAALDSETIVVDADDSVVQAAPATYRLGLVRDDAIADERLREQIMETRRTGQVHSFELITQTAQDYAMRGLTPGERLVREQDAASAATSAAPAMTVSDAVNSAADAHRNSQSMRNGGQGKRFSSTPRKNWLRITVVSVSDQLIVVLVTDDSDRHRFEQLRDDFVSNVTTQLDEPAQALEQLGESLSNPDVNARDVQSQAEQVTAQAKYLRHLVSDLIILLKAQGSGSVKESPVLNLEDVARDVVTEEQPRADTAHVTLEFKHSADPQLVHGNADQLHAAIAKLVENAIEFSPDRSHVSIAVEPDETGDYTQVRVVDNGPGIPAADQDKIFQRFYRGKTQQRVHGGEDGTGLGLSIVKHVALTHQGRVDVWSKPGSGSTFTIVLPKATDGECD